MRPARVTVTILAAALVVIVTTVALGAIGLATYLADRNWQWRHLRSEGTGIVDRLSVELPQRAHDDAQIDELIESQLGNPDVQAVVVRLANASAPGGYVTHARARDASGKVVTVDRPPPKDKLLVEELQLTTPAGNPLGSVQVYMTPRVIQADLQVSLYHLVWVILLLDVLLSASLYSLLWWTVLRPLKEIEHYAASVPADANLPGPLPAVPVLRQQYVSRELTSLRDSIVQMVRQLRTHLAERQKNEAMLTTILDAVPYGIWWKDPQGVFLGCNYAFIQAAGFRDAGGIIGKTDFDLPWPRKEAEAYRADDLEVLTTKQPKRHIIEPITHADGPRRWADTTKVPLVDSDGVPYAVLGVAEDITERKEAEDALLREKAFNDAMLLGMPGVLFLHDDQGRLIRWNSRAKDVYGFTDEELRGKYFLDWMPEDQRERTLAAVHDVMRYGYTEMEGDVLLKGGVRVPHYITGIRLTIEGKLYMLVVGIDISERKRAEDALRHEKTLTDAIFNSVPGVIHLYDEQNRLVRWNSLATELSGFSDEELMLRPAGAGRTGEQSARIVDTIERVKRDGRATAETTLLTKDGNDLPIFVTAVRVILDGKPYVLGIGIDISERKRVEDTLRREKALTDAVFDNVPAVLSLYDDQGRLVRWNRMTNEITGFSDEDLSKRVVGGAQPEEERERIAAAVRQTISEGHTVIEATLLTKSGGRIPFYYTGIRLMLDGKPHILSIGVDIRERKRAEEHLRRALEQAEAASRAKDQFLAAASHELRTPLTPVLLLTSSLEADPRLPAETRHDLGVIREHVEVERRLIGDLLDFSAIHAGKLKIHPVPTDVHDVLHAAIRTCQDGMRRKGQRLVVRLDARHHHTSGDPDRLRQVFWNLLQNACKFTPEHGTITVRTSDDGGDSRTLRIEVSDTGIGMNPETLRRLFQPFEQGPRDEGMPHYGGLGLGLAITKALVEAHGGSISATSEGPGRGSTFIVRLPVTAAAPPPESPAGPQLPPAERLRLRLLLVEDHPLTLKTLSRLLAAEGHDVTATMTVDEALQAAERGRFDLVLSDIGLPDGSGLALMQMLRNRYGLPGIALSGFGADQDVDASRRAGFMAHLTKPVTIDALREALSRFAIARSQADSPANIHDDS